MGDADISEITIGETQAQDAIDDDDFKELTLATIYFLRAADGCREALDLMFETRYIRNLLTIVSRWAEAKYRVDQEDVKQFVAMQLFTHMNRITSLQHIRPWCYQTAKRHCLSYIRHRNFEIRYQERARRGYESTRRGGKPILQSTDVRTPEQELGFKEALRKVIYSSPQGLLEGWASGKTPNELSQEMGVSVATVYRHLKAMQKALIKEFGLESAG